MNLKSSLAFEWPLSKGSGHFILGVLLFAELRLTGRACAALTFFNRTSPATALTTTAASGRFISPRARNLIYAAQRHTQIRVRLISEILPRRMLHHKSDVGSRHRRILGNARHKLFIDQKAFPKVVGIEDWIKNHMIL
jgi:hypothetical protein